MTKEQIAKIYEFLGAQPAKCDSTTYLEIGVGSKCFKHRLPADHELPLSDADAMACLRKLKGTVGYDQFIDKPEDFWFYEDDNDDASFPYITASDPAEAIFAAVLAYLEAANG